MSVEAVVFDIGNVLIEWVPEKYYDRTYGSDRRKRLFAEVDLHEMNDLVDLGHDFRGTIYGWAEKHPEFEREIRDWHDNWLELAQPVIPQSVRVMRALRAKGVPVFALSNFGVGSFDLACSAFDFLNEFDRAFISGQLRLAKPDAAIYETVETQTGIAPDRLIFADDRPANIAAAEARGWRTHLFAQPQAWADRLVAEGLLSEDEAK